MKLIIDISDTDMNKVNHSNRAFYFDVYKIMAKTIQNGTPLDKIRAEIIARDRNVKVVRSDSCCFFTAEEVLEIIDKYQAETEET